MEPLTFSVDPRRGLVLNKDAADRGTQNYVVVDPVVGRHLKRHQIEALLWLMSTLFGSCSIDESAAAAPAAAAPGAILAYSMGLGKTLITIAFLFTILNQSRADTGRGEVQKAVIIAPASVSQQWLQEFFKWLGRSRLRVTIAHDLAGIESFRASRTRQVLIVSMQLFLKHSEVRIRSHISQDLFTSLSPSLPLSLSLPLPLSLSSSLPLSLCPSLPLSLSPSPSLPLPLSPAPVIV